MSEPSRILLVDDDVALRTMLRGLLQRQGFAVTEAGERETALAMLEEKDDIPLVLLDLGLPPHEHEITEGIATLHEIHERMVGCKVIVLTGQDQEAAALAAIREGAFDFLAKPATPETIVAAVRRAQLFANKEREMGEAGVARIAINAQLGSGLKGVREEAEERLVRKVLKETGFNVVQSARRLGVKRENIYYFLKKFSIERDA